MKNKILHINYNSVKSFPSIEVEFKNITASSIRLNPFVCNRINSSFVNNEFYESCTKITEFMNHLKSNHDSDSISKKCNYLNYKINEELRRLKKVSYNNSEFYDKLISDYKNVGYDLNIICNNKNISYLDEDVFSKINDIRDIYINFNNFINFAGSSSVNNCQDINKSIDLYTKHKDTCKGVINQDFCVALDNFKKDYLAKVGQIVTTCKTAKESLESYINTVDGLEEEAEEEMEESDTEPFSIQTNSQMGQSKSTITVASSTILVLSSASFIIYKVRKIFFFFKFKINVNTNNKITEKQMCQILCLNIFFYIVYTPWNLVTSSSTKKK
ncbi:hypothetical protein PVMG_02542 [Plasmodium vivax Mauritania I]|uniref:Variable surface protein n=1 Tax=Plasmodium vivax Mauritania I TaxID=1035515 RepID=A0A0J9W339_PLAVI|nr:hypothetical protein PVMG_02542 [Plasmodium vivax Mauritania I]